MTRMSERRELLMQVLHGSGAEDDEKPHPEGGALERNHLVGFTFFRFIIGFEDLGVEKQRQQTEDEEELDKKNREVFCVVLHA